MARIALLLAALIAGWLIIIGFLCSLTLIV